MPIKKSSKKTIAPSKPVRPFRGPLKPKDIQTIDAGAGFGDYVFTQASRFNSTNPRKRRRYAAVEPFMQEVIYGSSKKMPRDEMDRKIVIRNTQRLREGYTRLKSLSNVEIVPYEIVPFMREMIQKNRRTRHLSINMPFQLENYNFEQFFKLLPRVIYPNGKVFITSESRFSLEKIKELSQTVDWVDSNGRRLKRPRALRIVQISPEELHHRVPNDLMKRYGSEGKPVYRLVLVIPPQK